jgi:hypothetical protein
MKKTKKYLLALFVGGMAMSNLKAQTDVRLLDLSIMKNFKKMQTTNPADSTVELVIHFKINKAAEAAKAHFWLGSAKDSSNILIAEPVFTTTGGKSYIAYNNVSTEIKKYETVFYVKVSKAVYQKFSAATLFVETTDGKNTTRLYYVK